MNRRNVLKTLPIVLGGAIAAPTLAHLLVSCNDKEQKEISLVFLDKTDFFIVEQLADIILPASSTIGALDVNVPLFIDKVLKNILNRKEQDMFVKGQVYFKTKFEEIYKKDSFEGNKDEFLELLSTYFNVDGTQQKKIMKILEETADKALDKPLYYIYKYLTFIRYYTLYGYYTSKQVGTEILNYDPVPGIYQSCIPVEAVGNISSI
ncbi:MAG: gluconate 2-dehydrogenase subunit 3 family protein [Aestuariibaculum sp.]